MPIQATQENSLTENDFQAGVNPIIATPEKLKPSPILNRKKMNLENIDANEIENFLQKYPQALPLIKEEFLSEEIKVKINSKPLVPFSIFTNSHKKRTRENNNEEETPIQKESVLTDNDCKKKLDASFLLYLDTNNRLFNCQHSAENIFNDLRGKGKRDDKLAWYQKFITTELYSISPTSKALKEKESHFIQLSFEHDFLRH